jgi:hypothetical protein
MVDINMAVEDAELMEAAPRVLHTHLTLVLAGIGRGDPPITLAKVANGIRLKNLITLYPSDLAIEEDYVDLLGPFEPLLERASEAILMLSQDSASRERFAEVLGQGAVVFDELVGYILGDGSVFDEAEVADGSSTEGDQG